MKVNISKYISLLYIPSYINSEDCKIKCNSNKSKLLCN